MIYYKNGKTTDKPTVMGVINPSHETILAAGWFEYINNPPPYNTETEKRVRGDVIEGVVQYSVVPLSDSEIKERKTAKAKVEKEQFTTAKLEKQIETELQALTSDSDILENKAGYPLWDDFPDQYPFGPNTKVQDFEGNELKLFKIIQPHNKQNDRVPVNTAALWSKIEFSGGIEVWSQPTGGDGKYPYRNPDTNQPYQVSHNGKTWENNVPNPTLNVWEPGVFGWTEVV